MPKRKVGAPLGNRNAWKTGWHSKAARQARWDAWQELERQSKAWVASRPQTDYGDIIDELIQLQQEARSHAPQKTGSDPQARGQPGQNADRGERN